MLNKNSLCRMNLFSGYLFSISIVSNFSYPAFLAIRIIDEILFTWCCDLLQIHCVPKQLGYMGFYKPCVPFFYYFVIYFVINFVTYIQIMHIHIHKDLSHDIALVFNGLKILKQQRSLFYYFYERINGSKPTKNACRYTYYYTLDDGHPFAVISYYFTCVARTIKTNLNFLQIVSIGILCLHTHKWANENGLLTKAISIVDRKQYRQSDIQKHIIKWSAGKSLTIHSVPKQQ